MADFVLRIQPNILIGPYTLSRIGQQIEDWGNRFMVIIDPILNDQNLAEQISQSLKEKNSSCMIFSELTEGISSKTVERALLLAREGHIQGVIAVGGEKAQNIGRAIAALYNEKGEFYSYLEGAIPSEKPIPCACIPSTFRSPFVFSNEVPITDARNHQIKLLHVQDSICKLFLVDSNIMLSLTESQKSILSIELLNLAIEAYLSQKANFFSDMFVEKGLEILSIAMDENQLAETPTPAEILLSQAGSIISLACSVSSLGMNSLLGLSIYSRYKVNKSLISAILLPFAIEDAAKFKAAQIKKIALIMKICNTDATEEEACKALSEFVRQKSAMANLPTRLKDLKLSIDELSRAVEDIDSVNLINNLPRSMTTDDLFEFVKNTY